MKCEGWDEIWPSKFARCVLDEHGSDVSHLGEVVTRFTKPKTQVNYDKWKERRETRHGRASNYTS